MVDLLLAGDAGRIKGAGVVRTVYDPCCGSGGMLAIAKEHISGTDGRAGINPNADIHLFGQEVNPETWAIFLTAELKNPLTGQTVADAIKQYRFDRDPKEPLLAFRRCLAHFAVDPDLVYVTTRLEGEKTRLLPFNTPLR